jgi:hypothetical protein
MKCKKRVKVVRAHQTMNEGRDRTMSKGVLAWLGMAMIAASAAAQTTVTTTGGTTNTVPVYTGSATVGNSPISVSGSNVGIGTTNPLFTMDVNGSMRVALTAGEGTPSFPIGGPVFQNNNAYYGSAVTIIGGKAGFGALFFGDATAQKLGAIQYSNSAAGNSMGFFTNNTQQMTILSNGNVGIGTTAPSSLLNVGSVSLNSSPYTLGTTGNTTLSTGVNLGNNTTGAMLEWNGATAGGYPIMALAGIQPFINASTVFGLNFSLGSWNNNNSLNGPVMTMLGSGNVGIGTTSPGAKLEVSGSVKLTAGSGASITFQDGSVQTVAYTGLLPGGDYADSVDVTGDRAKYDAGDLLVIDPDHPGKFLKSAAPYSTSVAGIFSTKPGTVGRRQTGPKSPDEVPMAMVGIVPTKVTAENGPIHPGDLLVTSSTLGYAMKGTDRNRMLGAVVGKALGSLDSGTGVIEVVVTLQ